jgi:hypothetical protein
MNNNEQIHINMGKKVVQWLSSIFETEWNIITKSYNNNNFWMNITNKKDLIKIVEDLCAELNNTRTPICGKMEEKILANDFKMASLHNDTKTQQNPKREPLPPALLIDNASNMKYFVQQNVTLAESLNQNLDGSSNKELGEQLDRSSNDSNYIFDKFTPIRYRMYWKGSKNLFYQKISLNPIIDKPGKIDITIELCINGHIETTTITEYDLYTAVDINASFHNKESITNMIIALQNNNQNLDLININNKDDKTPYNSTRFFEKALGDFLKNMDFFVFLSGNVNIYYDPTPDPDKNNKTQYENSNVNIL